MSVELHIPKHDEHFEAVPGLPEPLPAGERILWQGAPDWRHLAVSVFHVRKIIVYFGVLLLARGAFVAADTDVATGLKAALWLAPVFALAVGLLVLMAWLSARTTLYTLTDQRMVMRVGIVLTLSFNLPLRRIEAAAVHRTVDGNGDIALSIGAEDKIAFVHLWPHVRPWKVAHPQPMLRCVDGVADVAALLDGAWHTANGIDDTRSNAGAAASTRAAAVTAATPQRVAGVPELAPHG